MFTRPKDKIYLTGILVMPLYILLCVLIPLVHSDTPGRVVRATNDVTLATLQHTLEQEVITRTELQRDISDLKAKVADLLSYKSGYDELKTNYLDLRQRFTSTTAALKSEIDNYTEVCQNLTAELQSEYDVMKRNLQNVTSYLSGVEQELQSTKQTLSSLSTNQQTQNLTSSFRDMEMKLNSQKTAIEAVNGSLSACVSKKPFVALMALLSSDATPTKDAVVIFNAVQTNVGNAYTTSSGIFVAPVSGIYSFECTITTQRGDPDGYIMRNSRAVMPLFDHSDASGDYDYRQASAAITVHLDRGDRLWVEWNGKDTDVTIKSNRESYLSAHLVRAD